MRLLFVPPGRRWAAGGRPGRVARDALVGLSGHRRCGGRSLPGPAPRSVDAGRAVGSGGPTPEPSAQEGPAREGATDEVAAEAEILGSLSQVPDLSHYDTLREVVSLVSATTRSNWPVDRGALALKFASAAVPFLPSPRPMAEVFVWSPNFEGLHLRLGTWPGGVRWSDRRSDIRAEVLGLAQAQVKKNSLIVPTGAKGAFVLRPDAGAKAGGKDAYCAFIRALLDLTDNIVDGKVVHPEGIRCRDGDDPYLVVAPDKGTASFSDLANSISAERGFWLGDAFASGGSHGYDHKALGITAHDAWLSVRRHFRALGMDDQRDELRVVGVGDMSGDVFGNGMLQSLAVRLVGAFDHRHIFIDPAPRREETFEERFRLSRLPGSSWADFDLAVASPGAAVFSRQAKQVELCPRRAPRWVLARPDVAAGARKACSPASRPHFLLGMAPVAGPVRAARWWTTPTLTMYGRVPSS